MPKHISQQKRIINLAKVYIAQYLSKRHAYETYQEGAVEMLALYMINVIKTYASKVKGLLNLQGRTLANPLHLLVVGDLYNMVDYQNLLQYITKIKDFRSEDFDVIKKYGQKLFKEDSSTVNNYQPCTKYKNISYIPTIYTSQHSNPLPYRHPIHQIIPKPIEVAYKATKKCIRVREDKVQELENLEAYHRREIRLANSVINRKVGEEKELKKLKLSHKPTITEKSKKQQNQQQENHQGSCKDPNPAEDKTEDKKVQQSKQDNILNIRKSSSCRNLTPVKQIRKNKSSIDLTIALNSLEDSVSQDRKIAERHEGKNNQPAKEAKTAEKSQIKEKRAGTQSSPERLTLKKAVEKLKLPIQSQQSPNTQNDQQQKQITSTRPPGLAQNKKRSYGRSFDYNAGRRASQTKKSKFELISFL